MIEITNEQREAILSFDVRVFAQCDWAEPIVPHEDLLALLRLGLCVVGSGLTAADLRADRRIPLAVKEALAAELERAR